MQAILLAGGLGTRLRSVVSDRPKPMALIENRPFMEYVVHELSRHGVTDIVFAVGYKGSMVEEYFGDGSRFAVASPEHRAAGDSAAAVSGSDLQTGMHLCIHYAYEEELLGTAGAIKNAGRFITDDRFFVLNADTFYQIDYSRLTRMQQEEDLAMALVLRQVADISRYGEAVLDQDGRLTGFNEKTTEARPGTINGGVYLMTRELLMDIPEGKVSLENDMIPKWLREGRRLGGFVNDGYFIDIGIPEDYFKFIEDVKKGVVIW